MRRSTWIAIAITCAGTGLGCGQSSLPPPPEGYPSSDDASAASDSAPSTLDASAPDAATDSRPLDAGAPERTLFIGNSFTFTNDLPGTYGGLATQVAPGHAAPVVASVAYGGYTLTQHLADAQGTGSNPELATLLGTGDAGAARWSHVLLQEQSEIPGFDPSNLERMASMASTVTLSGYVAKTGATSLLFMTWGYAKGDPNNPSIFPDYPTMQALLETGYRQMAHAIVVAGHSAAIAPVGLAFQSIYQREVTLGHDPLGSGSLFLQLYGSDFIHPAVPGTYLAACVMTATVYGADPTKLTGTVTGIDAATQLVLQTAARDVVAAERAMPGP